MTFPALSKGGPECLTPGPGSWGFDGLPSAGSGSGNVPEGTESPASVGAPSPPSAGRTILPTFIFPLSRGPDPLSGILERRGAEVTGLKVLVLTSE